MKSLYILYSIGSQIGQFSRTQEQPTYIEVLTSKKKKPQKKTFPQMN